jgi:hypothetical protein
MPTIGPTFHKELVAAGVEDFRFSWTQDGRVEFAPEVPVGERKKVLAVLKAHDGALSEARHQALQATDAGAASRIADMFGKEPDTFALVWKENNAQARASEILYKMILGSALPEERLEIEVLIATYGQAKAIRDAEAKAKAALLVAKSVEEVQAVEPKWPPG